MSMRCVFVCVCLCGVLCVSAPVKRPNVVRQCVLRRCVECVHSRWMESNVYRGCVRLFSFRWIFCVCVSYSLPRCLFVSLCRCL